MIAALIVFAAEEAEPSKTPFYLLGSLFAVWAVVVSAIGISRHETFPPRPAVARIVMAVSFILMLGALGSAVLTS
jgi:hypothetical protein